MSPTETVRHWKFIILDRSVDRSNREKAKDEDEEEKEEEEDEKNGKAKEDINGSD